MLGHCRQHRLAGTALTPARQRATASTVARSFIPVVLRDRLTTRFQRSLNAVPFWNGIEVEAGNEGIAGPGQSSQGP